MDQLKNQTEIAKTLQSEKDLLDSKKKVTNERRSQTQKENNAKKRAASLKEDGAFAESLSGSEYTTPDDGAKPVASSTPLKVSLSKISRL